MRRSVHIRALALVIVLALVGAPAVGAVRNECNLCPADCPMHHPGKGGHGPRMKCHAGAVASDAGPTSHDRGPAVARPTCGNHGLLPATTLPPMLLPAASGRAVVPIVQPARPSARTWLDRQADPPDTPPPIGAA